MFQKHGAAHTTSKNGGCQNYNGVSQIKFRVTKSYFFDVTVITKINTVIEEAVRWGKSKTP